MTKTEKPIEDPSSEELTVATAELNRRRSNGETIVDDVDFIIREIERNRVSK